MSFLSFNREKIMKKLRKYLKKFEIKEKRKYIKRGLNYNENKLK
jgi:hypothetical protein